MLFFPTPSVELTVRQSMRMGSLTSKSIASISKVMERQSLGIGETGLEERRTVTSCVSITPRTVQNLNMAIRRLILEKAKRF